MGILDFIGDIFGIQSQENVAEAQMAFNAREADKNRQFQREMWNANNSYNTPSAQKQRMLEAGLNPWSPEGQGYASASNSSSIPQGSVAAPFTPVGQYYNPVSLFKDLSSAFKSVAEAKKTGVDTAILEQSMADVLAGIKAETDGKQLANQYQDILNSYADERNRKELAQIDATVKNILSDTTLKDQQSWEVDQRINESKARVKELLSQVDLNNAEKKRLEKFTNDIMDRYYNSVINVNKSTVKLNNAKTTEAYASANELGTRSIENIASANLKSALTATENMLREDKAKQQKAVAVIDNLRAKIKVHTFSKDKELALKQAIEQITREGLVTKQAAAELKRAESEGDWAQVYYFFRALHEGSSIATETTNAAANAFDSIIPF